MPRISNTEPFGTRRDWRFDAYGEPTREYERYLEHQAEHAKCSCCGEEFHVDALAEGECAECRAYVEPVTLQEAA